MKKTLIFTCLLFGAVSIDALSNKSHAFPMWFKLAFTKHHKPLLPEKIVQNPLRIQLNSNTSSYSPPTLLESSSTFAHQKKPFKETLETILSSKKTKGIFRSKDNHLTLSYSSDSCTTSSDTWSTRTCDGSFDGHFDCSSLTSSTNDFKFLLDTPEAYKDLIKNMNKIDDQNEQSTNKYEKNHDVEAHTSIQSTFENRLKFWQQKEESRLSF